MARLINTQPRQSSRTTERNGATSSITTITRTGSTIPQAKKHLVHLPNYWRGIASAMADDMDAAFSEGVLPSLLFMQAVLVLSTDRPLYL